MFAWTTVVIFIASLLAIGPLRGYAPFWLLSGAELIAAVSLFVLVCVLESGSAKTGPSDQGP